MAKVFLTGASSFTGYWFARALAERGLDVTLHYQKVGYSELPRAERVKRLKEFESVRGVPFGSPEFIRHFSAHRYDLLALHGASVAGYKAADFKVDKAVEENIKGLKQVLAAHSGPVVLTGTYFGGSEPASPYGLAKTRTEQELKSLCEDRLFNFTIPNPFGPLEDHRFTHYAVREWYAGKPALVRFPKYKRDNIQVQFLARKYAEYAQAVLSQAPLRAAPGQFQETQLAFTERLAREIRQRTGLKCEVRPAEEPYTEPMERVNPEASRNPNEARDWDEYVAYCETLFK
jgi:UDP-glucose 4-epimerase